MFSLLFVLLAVLLNVVALGVTIYGVVISFKKAWYVGLAALVFPIFGFVVGGAKLLLKKNILN